MTREEAIKVAYGIPVTKAQHEALQFLIPELAESEDERMIRKIESFLSAYGSDYFSNDEWREIEVWLEKQKEQKPVEWNKATINGEPIPTENQSVDIPLAEWSEEDERILTGIIERGSSQVPFGEPALRGEQMEWLMNRLKSLRSQPREEIYHAAKHDLAIRFMNYLDENRPEGKMGLSNGECEDIDKAFKENDWAKIMRYVEKYRPSWKPSEQEKGALRTAIHVLTEERNFPKAAAQLQNILDTFEGKESRKDFKPSEEQMEALKWLIEYVSPSEKYIVIVKNLYEQLNSYRI